LYICISQNIPKNCQSIMEIKHTVEILTKDIQEIEKLVRNLNNSPTPPKIELDLALAKLRNVYELLSMIREDMDQLVVPEHNHVEQITKQVEEKKEEPVAEPASEMVQEKVIEQAPEPVEELVVKPVTEPVAEEKTAEPEPEVQEPKPQEVVEKQAIQVEIHMEEPAANKEEITQQIPDPEIKQEAQAAPEPKKKEAQILAEKFSNDPSINENIASATKTADISSKITAQPIDNIGRNIGINDRFLIIRELFEGNNDNYTQLIRQLDSSANEQEALGLLEIKFPEATEHAGYQLLAQLAKRKFITD
jgi:hypothetical protein